MTASLVWCAGLFCTYLEAIARAVFARVTLAKMSEALAVQMKGLVSMLCFATYRSMANSSSGTLVKLPRRMRLSVMSRKKRSAMFSHDAPAGVKCMTERECLASQA
jgi:hypothetical protein